MYVYIYIRTLLCIHMHICIYNGLLCCKYYVYMYMCSVLPSIDVVCYVYTTCNINIRFPTYVGIWYTYNM